MKKKIRRMSGGNIIDDQFDVYGLRQHTGGNCITG